MNTIGQKKFINASIKIWNDPNLRKIKNKSIIADSVSVNYTLWTTITVPSAKTYIVWSIAIRNHINVKIKKVIVSLFDSIPFQNKINVNIC